MSMHIIVRRKAVTHRFRLRCASLDGIDLRIDLGNCLSKNNSPQLALHFCDFPTIN